VQRDESFAAWIRFLRSGAAQTPTVLAFEDLHWAEPAMLDFVDEAVDGLAGTPVLVVATARPELFDHRPMWGGGKRNATTISLPGFTDEEMGALLETFLVRSKLPTDARRALARGAGRNPLYAREFVRMLADRGAFDGSDDTPVESVPVPDTVQSLIAARLDGLAPAPRSLVQDASVVGESFWSGALASMGEASGESPEHDGLGELERRGLVERVEPSSMEDQEEFRFTHALIRDVAYGQIPRAERARRHLAVARWIERMAGDAMGDRAGLLAHHYLRTLELSRAASSLGIDVSALEDAARDALIRAGEHAGGMDAAQASRFYRDALDLTPTGHRARPALLSSWATSAWRAGELSAEDTFAPYEEAIAGYLDQGDRVAAGATTRRLYYQLAVHGDTARGKEVLHRARELLEEEPPSSALAEVYVSEADVEMFAGRTAESLGWAEKALALGSLPGTETSIINALHIRGNARCEVGDPRGLEDLREALDRSTALGDTLTITGSRSFLGEWLWLVDGPEAGLSVVEPAIELLAHRGLVSHRQWGRTESLAMLFDLGRWDRLIAEAEDLLAWETRQGESQVGAAAGPNLARVRLHRGAVDEAAVLTERYLPRARSIEDLQVLAPALVSAALVTERRGDGAGALALVDEFDRLTKDAPEEYRGVHLPDLVRICVAAGEPGRGERLVASSTGWTLRQRLAALTSRAVLADANGDPVTAGTSYVEAALGWRDYGMALERIVALRAGARCLESTGRHEDAAALRAEAEPIAAALALA
jgi:hypothetical protein